MYQWSGSEEELFNSILEPFIEACGVEIISNSNRDAAVLDAAVQSTPPDILIWPTIEPLALYSDQLLPLGDLMAEQTNYADFWVNIGTVDGEWLALPVKADIKSIVWYSPAQFEAFGYEVPTTFEGLEDLVEQMVADGNVPWSMGMENGANTGWTGSDFIQDLLLTMQGPEYVMGIIDGSVAYNDPGVVDAYEDYARWASDPAYTVGGADGTVNTPFLDAIFQVFSDPPDAMMVKQSGFAGEEIVKEFPTLTYGTDFDFFVFPGIQGMQGGADFLMAFSDSPAAQALIAYLTGPTGAETWATVGFALSPNSLAEGMYADEQLAKKAEYLAQATGFTPDLGDSIPPPFGETEWGAIITAVQGGDIESALDEVAAVQAQVLGR
jgi:alpha-glucoside transport system substrate-binding protein